MIEMDRVYPTYIFDIDGTLANNGHRMHHIMGTRINGEPTTKDWEAFHETCHLDTPIAPVVDLCRRLICSTAVIFITGRMEKSRQKTAQWLAEALQYGDAGDYHDGQGAERGRSLALYMRGNDDFRQDSVVKAEVLDRILAETYLRPIMAFEDRPRVSAMWRERGLCVAHVGSWLVEVPEPKPVHA